LFDTSREVSEHNIFSELNKLLTSDKKLNKDKYRINLFANRDKLAGNETKETFRKIFRKHSYEAEGEKLLSDKETLRKLWHINYSISSSDLNKSAKGIRTAISKFNMPEDVVEAFTRLPEPKKQYAAYSSKAINKLLPLMRCGKYWSWENIDNETRERIDTIINEGWNFAYDKRTGELIKEREFSQKDQFAGLPVWMACYVAYGRHSERESDKKYTPEEIKSLNIMQLMPNNSLRDPIVEQVVRETMFLVKDLCNQYGQPDEIHIEMGRELKKNAAEKEKIAKNNRRNLEEKQRIKKLLYELLNGTFEHYDEDGEKINAAFEVKPNPENPTDVEKFRIYKSCGAITSDEEKENWDALFKSGNKEKIPTHAEIKKYILWLSQRCVSPYTGKIIPLSKLFTEEYEVEHIIPRKKIKYDAFENLVICERGVNKLKDNELAMLFISKNNGAELSYEGKKYKLQTTNDYISHCKKTFKGRKLKNLLATEVPEDFVERQINDTRYITRKVSELLYPVAKDKSGLIFTIGSITSDLKREWGLNNVWKEIVKPRFERLEQITGQALIVPDKEDANKFHFTVPDQPDFNDKRIDYRHHALDALIVAATTREHIRYLNSLNAADSSEELQKVKRALVKGKIRDYKQPWEKFTKEAKEKLCETIVTFKSNNKVVSKPANKYVKWFKSNESWEKKEVFQKPNSRWMAVRKSMFKEPQGIIWLKEKKEVSVLDAFKIQIERMKVEQDKEKRKTASYVYDQLARQNLKQIIENTGIELDRTELLKEIQKYLKKNSRKILTGAVKKNGKPEFKIVYSLGEQMYEKVWIAEFVEYATKRTSLSKKEYVEKLTEEKIKKDLAYPEQNRISKLMINHIREYKNNPKEAFNAEGLEHLNKKAIADPKIGKPIKAITRIEKKSPEDKFGSKYVEVDKGAIAYFIIYEDDQTKERPEMYSLATHQAIERLVQGKPIAEKREGYNTIILSPDDLVYVPTPEEWQAIKENKPEPINWNDRGKIGERIYRMVKSTGKQCFFIPAYISKLILPYDASKKLGELESQNCSEKTLDGQVQIKQCCIKIEVDRLGNI
jgi:CRISPR-associated endonuclease Csn1